MRDLDRQIVTCLTSMLIFIQTFLCQRFFTCLVGGQPLRVRRPHQKGPKKGAVKETRRG